MNENLRPSTLGEILDRTAQIFRRNFWTFVGAAAAPMGVMIAVLAIAAIFAVVGRLTAATAGGSALILGIVVGVGVLIATPIYIAAYVYSCAGLTNAAAVAQRGEKMTIRGVFSSVRPRFWNYLGVLFLQGLLVILVPGVIAAGIIGLMAYGIAQAGTGVSILLGFAIFLVSAGAIGIIVWLGLGYAMSMSVSVVEQKPPWESLQRAAQLSRGSRGRIFVLFLLLFALAMVVGMIAYVPFVIIVAVIPATGLNSQATLSAMVVAEIIYYVVNLSLQTVLAPIPWIALMLFYYDQRIRKEGLDIELLMEQAGMIPLKGAAQHSTVLDLAPSTAASNENQIISGAAAAPDSVGES